MGYLYAEAVVRGGTVLLPAGHQGEDAAVLQVGQQLQVSGLLQGGGQTHGGELLSTAKSQRFTPPSTEGSLCVPSTPLPSDSLQTILIT